MLRKSQRTATDINFQPPNKSCGTVSEIGTKTAATRRETVVVPRRRRRAADLLRRQAELQPISDEGAGPGAPGLAARSWLFSDPTSCGVPTPE